MRKVKLSKGVKASTMDGNNSLLLENGDANHNEDGQQIGNDKPLENEASNSLVEQENTEVAEDSKETQKKTKARKGKKSGKKNQKKNATTNGLKEDETEVEKVSEKVEAIVDEAKSQKESVDESEKTEEKEELAKEKRPSTAKKTPNKTPKKTAKKSSSKKANRRTSRLEEDEDELEDEEIESFEEQDVEYEVEKILDERNLNGVLQYKVRWKGYTARHDTWEPVSELKCDKLISQFKEFIKKAKEEVKEVKEEPRAVKRTSTKPLKEVGGKKAKVQPESEPENEAEGEYEVAEILEAAFKKDGGVDFLVRWKGFTDKDNTWEPLANLQCPDLIRSFAKTVETSLVQLTEAPQSPKKPEGKQKKSGIRKKSKRRH